jgi:hypothetical protein
MPVPVVEATVSMTVPVVTVPVVTVAWAVSVQAVAHGQLAGTRKPLWGTPRYGNEDR